MPPPSPTVAAWELALRLRQRREQLDVAVKRITDTLKFTRNYWSAVENHRAVLSAEKLATLLDLLEYDADERAELMDLRDTAKQQGWWAAYSALFDDNLLRYHGLEYGAQTIRTYESLTISGLLQTAGYARAMMASDMTVRQVEVDQRVAARLHRQRRLDDEAEPLQLTVLLSQAALVQQIGGREVLSDQLDHLATVIEQHPETVDVRVIPFTATSCGVFGASTFHLLDFASARLPTLAWQETVTARSILDRANEIRDLSLTYAEALRQALDREQSLALIREHARE